MMLLDDEEYSSDMDMIRAPYSLTKLALKQQISEQQQNAGKNLDFSSFKIGKTHNNQASPNRYKNNNNLTDIFGKTARHSVDTSYINQTQTNFNLQMTQADLLGGTG